MLKTIRWATLLLLSWACLGQAQVIDGTLVGDEGFYGTVLSVQNTDTHFGNSDLGVPEFANGSEIDQVFGRVANGRLYMLFTGNLESNFNKLEVFIDSVDGGVNTIVGADLPTEVDGFCCTIGGGVNLPDPTSGALQRMNGLTFDADFDADYYLTFSDGTENLQNGTLQFWAFTAHYAQLNNGTSGATGALGMQLNPFGLEPGLSQGELVDQNNNGWNGPDDPSGTPPQHEFVEPISPSDPNNAANHRDMANVVDLRMAIDNRNTAGVNGSGGPNWDNTGDPENVVSGIEFSVPLSFIGNPTGEIAVTAFINGTGHDYASNQFAGFGLAGAALIDPVATDGGNPGGDGFGGFTGDLAGVNLTTIPGDQFVVIAQAAAPNIDFNNDGLIDCADVNALTGAIVNGGDVATFDLNADGMINNADMDIWLADGAAANGFTTPYFRGDANLDGSVDVSDFNVWNGAKFTSVAAFCSGDFNADGTVDVSDFNIWNGNKFQSSGMAAVPEPGSLLGLLIGVAGLLRFRRR